MNTDAINASAFFASTFITARVPVRPMQCNAGFLRDLVANLAGWAVLAEPDAELVSFKMMCQAPFFKTGFASLFGVRSPAREAIMHTDNW